MKIKFHKNLYSYSAIKDAILQFKNVAEFKVSKKENYFIVSLDKDLSALEYNIVDEFVNYVLFLTIFKRKQK